MPSGPSDIEKRTESEPAAADVDGGIQDIVIIMEELRFQLHESREVNRALEAEIETATTRIDALQTLTEARGEELEHMKRHQEALRSESDRLLTDLTIAGSERVETAKEIRRLRQQTEAAEAEARAREQAISDLTTTVEELRNASSVRARNVEDSVAQLQERLEVAEKQLELRGQELAAAHAKVTVLREERDEFDSQVRALERTRADLDKVRTLMQAFALRDGEDV